MDARKPPELPNEMVNYFGTFFSKSRTDLKARNTARMVCRQWAAQIPPCLHLYILGTPVLVEKSIDPQKLQWETISAETIQNSFDRIPQDGFLVFPTYTDAHLYAHQFYYAQQDPNLNAGGAGTQSRGVSFLTNRGKLLYHPVVFEVAYSCKTFFQIEWHPSTILNLDGNKTMRVSAIREPNCKSNLEVLSSKLEVEFVNNKKIELAILHDSAVQAKHGSDPHVDVPEERGRCLIM